MDKKQTILIVDDNEINRMILSNMLEDEFSIMEAKDGQEAIDILGEKHESITLVLLDAVMPHVDGFGVLAAMNSNYWIDDTPVIMISAETSPDYMHRAFELGTVDYVSRPFNQYILRRRIKNTIMLYAKQRQLVEIVTDQIRSREKENNLMVAILSHIVEFRNGESGRHVQNINIITEMLFNQLLSKTTQYDDLLGDGNMLRLASSLHDIGKISIPEEILNKPGRLTPDEFEVMKTHTTLGAKTMEQLDGFKNEKLVKYSYDICRWHHERWDGRGYPDGLKGDEIPIAAQIVSLADVYDALTSKRCYKEAYSHEKSMQMILNGECGLFNPLLLECLQDIATPLQKELQNPERILASNNVNLIRDFKRRLQL